MKLRTAWLGAVLAAGLVVPARTPASEPPQGPATGEVAGLVTTAGGRAVPGARVALVDVPELASTADADGRFRLPGVPAGLRRLRAELAGFGRAERDVEVRAGVTTELALALPFLPFAETVTVAATRGERKLGDSPAGLTLLTREDLGRFPSAAVDEALKQVPGFSLFRRTSSLVSHPTTQGVSLRGVGASGASRTLVLVDGVPHNDGFGNWVYWDTVPQLQLESIEVAPSGLSDLYGSSAMAGVISVTTRRPRPGTASLQAFGGSRGSANAEGFGSHAWGGLSGSVGGSYFRTDGYTLVREDERGPVDVPASSRHRTGSWRLEYARSSKLTFHQNGRVFAEERENGTPLQANASGETMLGGGLRAASEGGSVWQANVYARLSRFESTFSSVAADRASETLSLAQAVDYDDVGGNLQWTRQLGGSHQLSAGLDLRLIQADDSENVFVPSGANVRDRLIPARQRYAGAYLQDVITAGRRAVVTLGLRLDHWRNYDASQTEVVIATGASSVTRFADTSQARLTPRAGLLVRVRERLSLRGSVYGGFRAPSLNELYRPFRVGNVQTLANPELGPERLLGGELGINHAPGARFSWRATAFWDRVSDPVANVTLSATSALITRQRQNLGRARVRGVSLEADYQPLGTLRLQASYLLSDARVAEFSAAPELEGNLLPQVPRQRASVRLDLLHPAVANVSLRARYESLRYDDDQNSLPLSSLVVVDLALDRPLGRSWGAFVSVQNLLDRRYAVQATPVELLGTPLAVAFGVRYDLRRR